LFEKIAVWTDSPRESNKRFILKTKISSFAGKEE